MHQPISAPFGVLLLWAQKECWRLSSDAPFELGSFTVTIKFVYSPGYTGDTGCRFVFVTHRNKAELKRHLQNNTSESRSSEIVRQEYERLKNFNQVNYGELEKVGTFYSAFTHD
jgi:hypothetical protein